ncbi:MAG: hypothetical protein OQJ98_02445 [Candidatus Pacebacteria bacterium]|nr:hypothetical protein [Candidatus Paceibacterota bacterium]
MNSISWQDFEHDHTEKSGDWFWALGIIALSGAITAILFENILFALLIFVGAFTIALLAAKKPDLMRFEIGRRGIVIDDTLYPFTTLESFWVEEDEEDDSPALIVKSQRFLMSYLVIPLRNTSPEQVRQMLLEKLDEEELHEPIAHRILEFFGF